MRAVRELRQTLVAIGLALAWFGLASSTAQANEALPDIVERLRPGVVGVGTVLPTRSPPNKLLGTGFAVADGNLVVTNAHVVDELLDRTNKERYAVFAGRGREARAVLAEVVAKDTEHDIAVLRLDDDERLPAIALAPDERVREGQQIAFIGFPIGAVLGLYPVTHTGIISAITPIAIPARSARELSPAMIKRLSSPFDVYQLDATAYPGNSGSPVFSLASGRVVAIVNQVYVKGTKENILKDPSAITYSMPARYIVELLESIP